MTTAEHRCIDCRKDPPKTVRKIATPEGKPPRCATHQRIKATADRKRRRAAHIERTYDISAADAHALYVYQGGRCWICGEATGATKALALDHDHADDWPRGRLCGVCNQFIGQRLGDRSSIALRLFQYLSGNTPYRQMLARRLPQLADATGDVHVVVALANPGHFEIIYVTDDGHRVITVPEAELLAMREGV
jgi:hypothetical protein